MHYLSTPGDRCEIIFQGLDALWPQSDCGYSTCRIVACEKLGPFGSPKILGPWLPYPRINASGHHMDTTGRHMVTAGHHMIATWTPQVITWSLLLTAYMIHCSADFMMSANASGHFVFEERGTINVKVSYEFIFHDNRRDNAILIVCLSAPVA